MHEGPHDPELNAEKLFDFGEDYARQGSFTHALERFQRAWEALPEPKAEQDLAVPTLAAIADCHFYLKDWDSCHEAMQRALQCGASVDNPFIRLRLGQSLFELGNEREAANWLVPVYLTEGRAPFAEDDPKYLEFFRGKLKPPEGGWPEGW
jgi:tetratricopeptide (TPR) repeat protein